MTHRSPDENPVTHFPDTQEPLESDDWEVERYELSEPQHYWFAANRREFTQTLGAGLLVAVSTRTAEAQRGRRGGRREAPVSQRFHLGADGIVTVLTSKVEVGQGARTQLTQAAAEELRLPVDRVRLIMAEVPRCPDDGGTAGSRTTPSTVPRVRKAAALLGKLLAEVAAERLGVSIDRLQFADGAFREPSGRQVSIGDLAVDEQLKKRLTEVSVDSEQETVPVSGWKTLGTAVPKVGGRDVVTGAAKYPSDIQLPGMLYGKVLRPPSFGATLQSIDLTSASEIEEAVVVRDGDFVGCAAPTTWQATRVLDTLASTCQWTRPSHPPSDRLFEHLRETADEEASRSREDEWQDGLAALAESERKLTQRYTVAYVQHAPMEPRAAVAQWNGGDLTVWTGTQQPSRVHRELCQTFRLPTERVRLIVPDTGGGFGGKHTGEVAVEAARLAKAAGRPVSIRWTREEEFTWAYFRPAGLIEVSAGLDPEGNMVVWELVNYNSGRSAIETPYRVRHQRSRFLRSDAPLRQGSYRALASTANTFARESAMDELAELAGADPLEFRLRQLPDGRLKNVLRSAADRFRWRERWDSSVPDRGVGLACGTEKGSFVAACVEVDVSDGDLRVLEVCQAFECGAVHNPDNLAAQNAGCIVMGLGAALTEAIGFSDGQITNPRFSAYRVPRMRDLPKLDLVQVDRPDLPSVGAGETPIIAVAPAVANAVADAMGFRSRSMPIRLPS